LWNQRSSGNERPRYGRSWGFCLREGWAIHANKQSRSDAQDSHKITIKINMKTICLSLAVATCCSVSLIKAEDTYQIKPAVIQVDSTHSGHSSYRLNGVKVKSAPELLKKFGLLFGTKEANAAVVICDDNTQWKTISLLNGLICGKIGAPMWVFVAYYEHHGMVEWRAVTSMKLTTDRDTLAKYLNSLSETERKGH
jgi:hypothetical protein